jgi:hypothetical protein
MKIWSVLRERHRNFARAFTSRAAFLGLSIGLVLAFVVWGLLANGYAVVGLAGVSIVVLMSCFAFWVRRPIFITIYVALFVGSFLGVLLWNPPVPDRASLGAEVRQHLWPWAHRR